MQIYNLYKFLKEELKNGSNDLVTRPSGQVIRERIERDIAQEEDGAIVALVFQRLGSLIIHAPTRSLQSSYQDSSVENTAINISL